MKKVLTTLSLLLGVFICHAEPIENLDQMLASGDRMKALNFVQKKKKSEAARLSHLIANQFFKQKTQEVAELALSYWVRSRSEAEIKVLEGLKIEPDNLYLLSMKWILLLEKNECKKVEEDLKIWNGFSGFEEINLIKARVAMCQKSNPEVSTFPKQKKIMWGLVEAQQYFERLDYQKLSILLNQLVLIDENMPEVYWWIVKNNRQLKLPVIEPAKKYLALCRNISHRQIREYLLQPSLCQQTKEVEDLLK